MEFDQGKKDAYAAEAKNRWGETQAYRAFEQRTKTRSDAEADALSARMTALFADFGTLKDADPRSDAAQAKVKELQAFITEHYYPCTDEILSGFGQMYAADERFKENIDGAGGSGTAAFVQKAIAAYCERA